MRLVEHADPTAELPPRMPAPMTPEDLSDLSIALFRFQGEIARNAERFGPLWTEQARHTTESFHGLVLALQTFDSHHSVRVPLDAS